MRIESTAEWNALHELSAEDRVLARLFADDPTRVERLTRSAGDLLVDLSKNLVDERVMSALLALAKAADVEGGLARQAAGERVNLTEDRAVGHMALRTPGGRQFHIDGANVMSSVHVTLGRMGSFADSVQRGLRKGATGRRFTDVVNIGIGGSDLGPSMAYEALRRFRHDGIRCHFVSNVDPADLASVLATLDPETTLFVVASKTFTTLETIANARAAREWMIGRLGVDSVGRHFVALSTNTSAVAEFGIESANVFPFWDWVGGRYSLPSAIGLTLMIAIGTDNFTALLRGMHLIDRHAIETPSTDNVPLLMAMVGIWNRNFLGMPTKAVLPYSHDLRRFPAYLQQLDMESNGKSVLIDGAPVGTATGPIVWGEPGTNAQHAFLQLMHQGTDVVPCDLIGFANTVEGDDAGRRNDLLFTNLLAQAQALAFGRTLEEVSAGAHREHRVFPGNRPSSVIVAPALTPSVLGQLIALYEHIVHFQGLVWGINSFDQWGVELGKELAGRLAGLLDADESTSPSVTLDASTAHLLDWYRRNRAATGRGG